MHALNDGVHSLSEVLTVDHNLITACASGRADFRIALSGKLIEIHAGEISAHIATGHVTAGTFISVKPVAILDIEVVVAFQRAILFLDIASIDISIYEKVFIKFLLKFSVDRCAQKPESLLAELPVVFNGRCGALNEPGRKLNFT